MSADYSIDFPVTLHRTLDQLDPRPGLAFMAALCERLLPNHLLYVELTGDGDAKGLRAVMDLIWEALAVRDARIDFERQGRRNWSPVSRPPRMTASGTVRHWK
ncbi:DUF416 family protein [Kushneria phosphatilytica]|uniref:DUF416 family protein n=1 Tax=Kushneria phosphatilytica TaxID=657387 RepID=UPI0026904359